MKGKNNLKRIAWISIPAFVNTDRFVIPELSKYYNIDYYILSKNNEKIDFIEILNKYSTNGLFNLKVLYIKFRHSDPRTIMEYVKFVKKIKEKKYDLIYNMLIGIPYYMIILRLVAGNKNILVGIHNVHIPKVMSIIFRKFP